MGGTRLSSIATSIGRSLKWSRLCLEFVLVLLYLYALACWSYLRLGHQLAWRLPRFCLHKAISQCANVWLAIQETRESLKRPPIRYTGLSESGHIRLLTIVPGSRASPIFCTTETVTLDNHPDFVAVSYTWSMGRHWPGFISAFAYAALWIWAVTRWFILPLLMHLIGYNMPDSDPGSSIVNQALESITNYLELSEKHWTIVCDGMATPVSENLYKLLLELRESKCNSRLWVDAICIDQNNVPERNQQILLMPHIYNGASRVLAWLGPCPLILDDKRIMGSVQYPLADADYLSKDWIAVLRAASRFYILWRSYFTRVWIVQEVLLAKELDFWIGSYRLSSDDLEELIRLAYRAAPAQIMQFLPNLKANSLGLLDARRLYRTQRHYTLADHLIAAAGREGTDPRDLVYAGVGLMADAHPVPIDRNPKIIVNYPERYSQSLLDNPDYGADIRDVVVHCGIKLLQEQGLFALSFGFSYGINERPELFYLPSWAPHFRRISISSIATAESKEMYAAGGSGKVTVTITPSELLYLESGAVILDTIVKAFSPGQEALENVILDLHDVGDADYAHTAEATITALARTLIADSLEGSRLGAARATLLFTEFMKKRVAAAERKVKDDAGQLQPILHMTPWNFKLWDVLYADTGEKRSRVASALRRMKTHEESIGRRCTSQSVPDPGNKADDPGNGSDRDERYSIPDIEPHKNAEPDAIRQARLAPNFLAGWSVTQISEYFYPEQTALEKELKRKLDNFSFFRTKLGYYGIGSPYLDEGHAILVPVGSHLPYAGRRLNSVKPTPRFKLLGEVYVHGIMDGELIDSDHWQPQVISIR